MKCNRCGREFGDGLRCQHCGIDRVEGIGSFSGLFPASGNATTESRSPHKSINVAKNENKLCFHCGEVIPIDSNYCPHCGASQVVICPNCGTKYPAQYKFCNKCGVNRESFLQKKREKEKEEKQKLENQRRLDAEKKKVIKRLDEERKQREKEEKERLHAQEVEWVNTYLHDNRFRVIEQLNENRLRIMTIQRKAKYGVIVSIVLGIVDLLLMLCLTVGMAGFEYLEALDFLFGLLLLPILIYGGICAYRKDNAPYWEDRSEEVRQILQESFSLEKKSEFEFLSREDLERLLNYYGIEFDDTRGWLIN